MTADRRRAAMRSVLALLVAVLLVGCGSTVAPGGSSTTLPSASVASTGPTSSPTSSAAVLPLVTVETRGGECAQGACGSLIQVEADGRLHQLKPTDAVLARIPPDLVEALQVEIDQANFALIESRPFTDTCPVAYDGQEVVYTFTVRQGAASERIASCEVAIDENHPLFRAVSAVLALGQG